MRSRKRDLGSMSVAVIALLVALGGTAGAVGSAAVPLAKRALVADRAKVATTAKIANTAKTATRAKTAATVAAVPTAQDAEAIDGVASSELETSTITTIAEQALAQSPPGARPTPSIAPLWRNRSVHVELAPAEEGAVVVSCEPGQAVHGGFQHIEGFVLAADSHPTDGGTAWRVYLVNPDDLNPITAAVHVVCLY
jgi:hypothetical protein